MNSLIYHAPSRLCFAVEDLAQPYCQFKRKPFSVSENDYKTNVLKSVQYILRSQMLADLTKKLR